MTLSRTSRTCTAADWIWPDSASKPDTVHPVSFRMRIAGRTRGSALLTRTPCTLPQPSNTELWFFVITQRRQQWNRSSRVCPGQLDELGAVPPADQGPAPGRLCAGPHVAEQRPLVPAAGEDEARHIEFAEPL